MTTIALILLLLGFQDAIPFACRWGTPIEIGSLDPPIDEASGLAISRRFPNRAYHINDSGDTGRFFVTDLAGRNTRTVRIAGFQPKDTEDLALGPCDARTDCLFIADIGDNDRVRKEVEIVVVEERADFPADVRARYRVRARYPDGAHDAESLGVHPDGTVYIMSKNLELDGLRPSVRPAEIYKLKRDQWRSRSNAVQVMELVAKVDFAKLLPTALMGGRLPTGMSIDRDGTRFLVLTYQDAIEFRLDLSALPPVNTWKEGQHYRRVPLQILPQQEAISYTADGKAFLYTTERMATATRIMKVECN